MPTVEPIRKVFMVFAALFVGLLLTTLSPLHSEAQSTNASVSGRVTDQSNAVIPNTEIEMKNVDTGSVQTTKTNGDGIYSFPALPPGNYIMSVRKEQFQTVSVTGIVLNVQDEVSRNFVLRVGSSAESVTVRADQNNINTTDASVSTLIDRQFVENIPLNGRSLQSLITLTPGVLTVPLGSPGGRGEFSVNGQRTEANYFSVDGVSGNTGASAGEGFFQGVSMSGGTPAETQLGTTQSLISLDALQEFRSSTSTYSAEYGRTPGGQFSFVSRSGANTWHGSAFDYFRNEALDANSWFSDAAGIPKTPERQNDFGGTLGGPLSIPGLYSGKDRTFFFFSYEGLRLQLPAGAVTDQYPDANLRRNAPPSMQPFLNAFPVPNGPEVLDSMGNPVGLALYTVAYSNPSNLDSLSIRIDHNLTNRTKIFGRYSSTSSASSGRSAGADLANFGENVGNIKTITAGGTTVFSAGRVNELRFNYTRNDTGNNTGLDTFGGAQPFKFGQVPGFNGGQSNPLGDTFVALLLFGASPSVTLSNSNGLQRQWNFTDAFTVAHGAHSLKFGVDYRRLSTLVYLYQLGEEGAFFSQQDVLAGSPGLSLAISHGKPPEPIYTNFSTYAEDNWRLNTRLTLSLGLRWDVNPPPGNANGHAPYTLNQVTDLATAQLAPTGTPLWQTDYLAFAPRLGAAYVLRRSAGHETVLRGGFGIFYDMGNTTGSSGFSGIGFSSRNSYFGAPFPLTTAQLVLPPSSTGSPYNRAVYAFDPHLRLPYTMEWNFSVEQALGASQTLKVMYVASAGRRLLFTDLLFPPTNPNFSLGNGLYLTTARASSNYQAFQTEFQKRLSRGLQALASYTWSHSIDDGSSNFYTDQLLRGNSDFDIRQNFQMALTYDIPGSYTNRFLSGLLKHWGLDTRFFAQSAPPVDIFGGQTVLANGQTVGVRPNLVPGVPVYVYGSQYPGGRILNLNAFTQPKDANGNPVSGNLARNFARGLGSSQLDLAIRREFGLVERLRLQFRAEAFNILNHPNFGSVQSYLGAGPFTITTVNGQTTFSGFGGATFGLNRSLEGLSSLYQVGGPRSLQLTLKLMF